ncbi:calcium-binding EF hand family protein [Corchorus olitorius]|uniref:Calcium-binding EF hand family protein n=1 Tax=Corchorus olitorius TaxID=93759 RepID=A0A1R3KPN8_9ROSI|nr:calcium-binding EF hand family protein [Corchorus olitorius]
MTSGGGWSHYFISSDVFGHVSIGFLTWLPSSYPNNLPSGAAFPTPTTDR